ncbi:MAG: glycosyltransferase family 2 protein [Candidatus Ornithomonoglobus sp.]
MRIKTTIGIAVYNIDEKYLRECIESAVAALNDETEIIIVDDCSTNGAGAVCREYTTEDERVRYICIPRNMGVSAVRNTLIENARGNMICFVDGDDILSEYFAEIAAMYGGTDYDFILFDNTTTRLFKKNSKPLPPENLHTKPLTKEMCRKLSVSCLTGCGVDRTAVPIGTSCNSFTIWAAFYNLNFLKKNNLSFIAGQKKGQDILFNIPAYYYAQNALYVQYPIYCYRNNPTAICHRYSKDLLIVMKKYLGLCNDYINELYHGDEELRKKMLACKGPRIAYENMQLNIFHKDNPLSIKDRKRIFREFTESEPFKSCFAAIEPDNMPWSETRLVYKWAKRKCFTMLSLIFHHPYLTYIYCKIRGIIPIS